MVNEKQVLLVAQKSATTDNPTIEDLFNVGVAARILQVMKMPNGTLKVLVEGLVRAKIKSITSPSGFLNAHVVHMGRADEKYDRETEALSRAVGEQFSESMVPYMG